MLLKKKKQPNPEPANSDMSFEKSGAQQSDSDDLADVEPVVQDNEKQQFEPVEVKVRYIGLKVACMSV